AGYRQFSPEDARQIRFIKRAQELGFTLKEIGELLRLRVSSRATCQDVKKKTENKLNEIDSKVKDLRRMKRALQEIHDCCSEGALSTSECPILECFESGGAC